MNKLNFFDSNCCVGVWPTPTFKVAENAKDLLAEMNHCGIKKALIHHSEMRFHTPFEGNSTLLKEIKGCKLLLPTRAILPPQTREQPSSIILLKEMKNQGIKVLFAFPNEHNYSLDSETFGDLFNAMVDFRIPLFVRGTLLQIRDLLRENPKLKVIGLSQGPHILDRYLRPLMENYNNFYFETSSYLADNGIEDLCKKYGPERILFGTGYPSNYMGSAMFRLLHADISLAYKRAIASGNLEKILSKVLI